ncbi:hypothetical protein CSE16_12880 [Solibacillus sp. R5-41]|uniref:hypothetical protein n=1 Tax=Solibacillus sp. R5-41 TaxID=2048654 RepID=UPI000C1250DD|nr:hypothetical protein [Solibacillus sp. R5-41]ATP40866.1 hypothetical protein CSE16_12880 [Solibacillus sp. R5-41]
MTLPIFIGLAIIIFIFSLHKTEGNKKNRLITGVVMLLSFLTFPLTLSLHEINVIHGLEGTGSLIVFHLLVSLGGIITIIAGIFTKKKPIESNE